jgi:hypothetical protein
MDQAGSDLAAVAGQAGASLEFRWETPAGWIVLTGSGDDDNSNTGSDDQASDTGSGSGSGSDDNSGSGSDDQTSDDNSGSGRARRRLGRSTTTAAGMTTPDLDPIRGRDDDHDDD